MRGRVGGRNNEREEEAVNEVEREGDGESEREGYRE